MPSLKIFLLGPPKVELDGKPITIRRSKALALLVYLAVTGEPQRRDTLAAMLWPESDQSRARATLRRELASLNKALGHQWLIVEREILGLQTDVWLDVTEFQRYAAEGQDKSVDWPDALTKAVELFRDDFLSGFTLPDCPAYDDWQFFEGEGLRQELTQVLETLIDHHAEHHDFVRAVPYARHRLALDPLHEPARQQLMRLYAWDGQWAAALHQYETCVRILEAELGVPPDPETEDLYQAIKAKQLVPPSITTPETPLETPTKTFAAHISVATAMAQDHTHLPKKPTGNNPMLAEHSACDTPSAQRTIPRHNLLPQPTSFIGREAELATLDDLIASPELRLVTIVGPGGMGKTRLALACAEEQLVRGRFANGVFFVALAPLNSTDHIIPTLAEALGFQLETGGQRRSPRQQILDYLRPKRMLIVMDNFEHLLDGGEIVVDLLQAAPAVKILVTSRERLHLHEEQVFGIQGLGFPNWETPEDAAEYTAVKLFIQSAQRVQHNFKLATDDLTYLTRICRLVEGMPLGIELAASWADTLSLADIAAEIQQSLDFLETEVRNIPARHRSIRAVFDTSWQRMSEMERNVFAQLSIFRGGFTRHAAQQIAGASLRGLGLLTSKSLLQFDKTRDRYQIHELLRQYMAEKLADDPENEATVRDRHSAFYCAALQRHEADLKGSEQLAALDEIEANIENVRLAWDWAIEQGNSTCLEQALESLGRFYEWYGRYQEGETLFLTASDALDGSNEGQLVRSSLLIWRATFNHLMGQPDPARQLLEQASALLDEAYRDGQEIRLERAALLAGLANLAVDTGNSAVALAQYEQSISLYQSINDRWSLARTQSALSRCLRVYGDHGTADEHLQALTRNQALAEETLAVCRELGDPASIAASLHNLGLVLYYQGQFAEAHFYLEEAVNRYTEMGAQQGLIRSKTHLGMTMYHFGHFDQTHLELDRAFALAQETGYRPYLYDPLWVKMFLAIAEETHDEIRDLAQEAMTISQEIGDKYGMAGSLCQLALANHKLGQTNRARQDLAEAFHIVLEIRSWIITTMALNYISWLWADLSLAERSSSSVAETLQILELNALAMRYPLWGDSPIWQKLTDRHFAPLTATLPPQEVAAAQWRGRNRNLWTTATEVLVALEKQLA